MKKIKLLSIGVLSTLLCACSGFFDKDNTPPPSPLVNFKPEARVQTAWSSSPNSGAGSEYLRLVPAITEHTIYTASKDGTVTATDKQTGRKRWSVDTHVLISGGPSAHDGFVLVGSRDGEVVALREADGKSLWQSKVTSEILAAPAVTQDVALIKSIDGKLTALSTEDGHTLWHYQQTEPTLILRGASTPQISHHDAVVGFANGNLVKLTTNEGSLHWEETVSLPEGSFAIQRMVDIDADPIVLGDHVYAATYQGHIGSFDLATGKQLWNYDTSSYAGIAADHERVYVSDAKSNVWAFDAETGTVDWRQPQLEARNITGPATIGNYVVVGDEQGYLHWMSKQDGHFVARVQMDSSGILAAPIADNNVLYVVSKDGHLAAYTIG